MLLTEFRLQLSVIVTVGKAPCMAAALLAQNEVMTFVAFLN